MIVECNNALHNLSASVFVISPQLGALCGSIPVDFNSFNCSGVQREQYICKMSHSWFICCSVNSRRTLLRTWGKHNLFSPPTTKHEIDSPSRIVSVLSLLLVSGVVKIGSCCMGKGSVVGCTKSSSSFRSGDVISFLQVNDKPGP